MNERADNMINNKHKHKQYTKDTVLFQNDNIKITAADVKLNIYTLDIFDLGIAVFVDISKYYRIQHHKYNCNDKKKYRNRKLIFVGIIYINAFTNEITQIPLAQFFDENCDIGDHEILDEDTCQSYFQSDCKRIDIYKNYQPLIDTDSSLFLMYVNDIIVNKRFYISSVYDDIVNFINRTFKLTIFNNREFIYRVHNSDKNKIYEYLISKKAVHTPYEIN